MTVPSPEQIFAALHATWPPASIRERDGWTLRTGLGGGQRVSAASRDGGGAPGDIAAMEAAQSALDQPSLVMVRDDQGTLDKALATGGYEKKDPTIALIAPVTEITGPEAPLAAYPSWPALAVQEEIWNAAGVGTARRNVMARVQGAKTALLGRVEDAPVATAFVAIDHDIAMVHALEVAPEAQRKGFGRSMMRAAARWSADVGARWLAVLVVEANAPAIALYSDLGMHAVTRYHYRRAPE